MRQHNFADSLAMSESYADAPWWFEVYREAFPTLLTAARIQEDGWGQRSGVDRVLTLSCSRVIRVDEKVRAKDWPDFALEVWSDTARKTPGWIQKPLNCEYIAYAFVPSRTCYLLPVLTLQRAWRLFGRKWASVYGEIKAPNPGYVTTSVPVPIDVVLRALGAAITVQWEA